jgi:DNA-binding winged helix-turn-helix (wHTH) protein
MLLRAGREQPLIPRYFDLLVFLVVHRNDAVHRREIFDAVWSDVVVSDSALSQAIRTIRRVLDDDPREPRFVRTVSRHGYQFVYPDITEEDDGPVSVSEQPIGPAPSRDGELRELVRLIARPRRESAAQEDQREAAERLHAFGTADVLERLATELDDTAFARALLRDTRWDVAGAGRVPIAGHPEALRVVAHLMRLRLSRAAGLVAARWAAAAIGVALAGAIAGAAGGLLLVLAPGSTSPAPAVVVLSALGAGIGAIAGAGVGAGIATSEAVSRSRRIIPLMAGGAAGGAAVGLAVQFLTRWTLKAFVGIDVPVGGAVEGLAIGAAAGLGYGTATSRVTAGLAAPIGAPRARIAAITAVASALAALLVARSGRPLAGGTIDAIAQASRGAQVALAPLGSLIGEPGFGRLTASITATGEGALFGAGLAFGLTTRRRPALPLSRISRTSHESLTGS